MLPPLLWPALLVLIGPLGLPPVGGWVGSFQTANTLTLIANITPIATPESTFVKSCLFMFIFYLLVFIIPKLLFINCKLFSLHRAGIEATARKTCCSSALTGAPSPRALLADFWS